MRFFTYGVLLLLCTACLLFIDNDVVINIAAGLVAAIIFLLIDLILVNRQYFWLAWSSFRLRNDHVRLSISYLFRIKSGDRYLLVRGTRFTHQFQPVGGVFKRSPGAGAFLEQFDTRDDDLIPIDASSKDDLRIRISGKYLIQFMRWYESRVGRETDPWREFYEELIAPGYLPPDVFPYISYRHIGQRRKGPVYSDYVQSYELLVAEIFELLPNDKQATILAQRCLSETENYLWVDEKRIRQRGITPKQELTPTISQTASWILE